MHPDYPELVKTALASDLYWRHTEDQPIMPAEQDPAVAFESLKNTIRIGRDQEMATRIGGVLMSLEAGNSITPIAWGEQLPIPRGPQVLRVIEDSRTVYSRLDPVYQLGRLCSAIIAARYGKAIRALESDFEYPTFEENLENIHASSLPFGPDAETVTPYGRTKVAVSKREVFYLKYDKPSGKFAALPGNFGRVPEIWDRKILQDIPHAKVGQMYFKDLCGAEKGRIISAHLVEATSIVYRKKSGNSPATKKNSIKDKAYAQKAQASPLIC